MKTKLKILKLLTGSLFVFLLIFFTNCNDKYDCPGYPPDGKLIYDFHKEDSLKIPYTGYDTLIFLRTKDSTIKDTIVFIGQGKKYSLEYLRQEKEMTPCEYQVLAKKYKIKYVAQNESDLNFDFVYTAGEGSGDLIDIYYFNTNYHFNTWGWDWGNGYYEHFELNGFVFRKLREQIDYYDGNNKIYYNFEYGILRLEREGETLDIIIK